MKRLHQLALSTVLIACAGHTALAQSLRGSNASVEKMFTRAVRNDLDFLSTRKGIYEAVRDGELRMISITMDLTLEKVKYPFVLPKTLDVLNAFAKKYHQACGERLVVTSAARPRTEQPRNASPKSVHPTGMAVDFRRPAGTCLTFMRQELMLLERQGVLEATEERHPVHFHVAVLQRGTFAPMATTVATTATAGVSPGEGPAPASPAAVEKAIVDSAAGLVERVPATPSAEKPAAPAKQSTYVVKKGDTLSEIAKEFGLSVARLRSINKLKGSSIRVGQKLRLR